MKSAAGIEKLVRLGSRLWLLLCCLWSGTLTLPEFCKVINLFTHASGAENFSTNNQADVLIEHQPETRRKQEPKPDLESSKGPAGKGNGGVREISCESC